MVDSVIVSYFFPVPLQRIYIQSTGALEVVAASIHLQHLEMRVAQSSRIHPLSGFYRALPRRSTRGAPKNLIINNSLP